MGVPVSEGVVKSFYFAFITTGLAAGLTYYLSLEMDGLQACKIARLILLS